MTGKAQDRRINLLSRISIEKKKKKRDTILELGIQERLRPMVKIQCFRWIRHDAVFTVSGAGNFQSTATRALLCFFLRVVSFTAY